MNQKPPIYVTYVGSNRVNLRGKDIGKYAKFRNAEFDQRKVTKGGHVEIVETVILNFASEDDVNKFLQSAIDAGHPFEDDRKTNAYQEVCHRKSAGKLKGDIRSLVWMADGRVRIG